MHVKRAVILFLVSAFLLGAFMAWPSAPPQSVFDAFMDMYLVMCSGLMSAAVLSGTVACVVILRGR